MVEPMVDNSELVDVIVRIHDPSRLDELGHAVLSLLGQSHRPLRVLVVAQRFDAPDLAALEVRLDRYRRIDPSVALEVIDYARQDGLADARSALINAGIAVARGRYLAVLDYDDTLYPAAYTTLVQELRASGCAVAFGGIARKSVAIDPTTRAALSFGLRPRHPGQTLVDMFRLGFCPMHSMVLDRSRIAPRDLRVDELLPICEDYEWQLRLGARYAFSFARIDDEIGEYRYKSDGSNTVMLTFNADKTRHAMWNGYADLIEERRQTLVIDPEVQLALGLAEPIAGLTIRGLLDRIDQGGLIQSPPDYLAPPMAPHGPDGFAY